MAASTAASAKFSSSAIVRRKSTTPRRGAGGWLLLGIAGAASIFAGWVVVKTSAADALIDDHPALAARVAPDDPRIPLEMAMTEFTMRGGAVQPATKKKVRAALNKAPLEEEPFILAAVDALVRNDSAHAQRLLEEARRRDPRSRITRLLLLDRFLRNGRIVEATEEMTALSGLFPQANNVLVGELARLAQNRETTTALEKALQQNPSFRDFLLSHLASNNADPDLILRLARNVPAPPGTSAAPAWQGQLVTSLAERGETDRAYQMWRTFSAPKAPERKAGIYDGKFQGFAGSGPFNWQFPASPAGVAERNSANALQVDYYGRADAELASQLIMLPPGSYRLTVRAEGDAEGEGSKLSWAVDCHRSKARVADLVLKKLTYAPRAVSVNFTVPGTGCAAQWLRLVGTAGEFPKPQNATISAVDIQPAS